MKRFTKRLFIYTSAIFFVVVVLFFAFRNQVLTNTANEKVNRFNKTHSAKIYYTKVCFEGIFKIHFDSLLITPAPDDTLLSIGSISVGLNIRQLITGHIRFRSLLFEHARIAVEGNKINDYFNAFTNNQGVQISDSTETNVSERLETLLKRIFTSIPTKIIGSDFSASYLHDSTKVEAYFQHLILKGGKLFSVVRFTNDSLSQTANLEGKIKPGKRSIEFSIKPTDEISVLHSPLAGLFDADISYKSLFISFAEKSNKENKLTIEGVCSISPFEVDHKALSSSRVSFPSCSMKYNLLVGKNYLEIDSISEIIVGELMFHPYLKYSMGSSDSIAFYCNIPTFTVKGFFNSISVDLFSNLKYVEAEGSLSYRAKLIIDLKQPDSLILESKLNTLDFKVKHIDGELLKMNSSFAYTAYEKGKPVRTFVVGPDNPEFLPLDQIPTLLQHAILMAEDCEFYNHKGFLISGIRRAISENIKEGKFARGGSTISQQLVKNVYLSREKTISRKLEEIILVWLIESNRLVSKGKMFEVYLNIIEWGPNVYGVTEASQFYFKKNANQLNASECVFLASVIPRPKKFYYRFDKEGKLAPFMLNYYNDMSGKMYRRGLIPSANGDSLSSLLKITGLAKNYLHSDTVKIDSIHITDQLFEEMDE